MRPERRHFSRATARWVPGLSAVALVLGLGMALPAAAQRVLVEPYVSGKVTLSDNIDAQEQGDTGMAFEATPGVAISRETGRINGRFDVSLRNLARFGGRGRDSSYLRLLGQGEIEAIERLLFFDLDASIVRNNPSLFTGRARGDSLSDDSDDETRNFSFGPRLEMRFGDTDATVGYLARWLNNSGRLGNQRLGQWYANARNASAFGYLGWAADYSRRDTSYSAGGNSDVMQEIWRATLFINVTPQFRLRAIGGHESNDYAVREGESGNIVGAGFDWRPTERTTVAATAEDRVFGRGYDVRFDHRRPGSAWEFGWSRDISSSLQTFQTLFQDPVFRQFFDALAASIPDPDEREQAVRDLLRALGYTEVDLLETVVSNNYFVDRRLRASFSLIGVRNVLTFSLYRSDRERLGTVSFVNLQDDLSSFDRVQTRTATVNISHRLTGITTLDTGLTRTHSKGEGLFAADTRRTLFNLGLRAQLGPRTTGGLSYRYQKAAGTTRFTENAIIASVMIRF